LPRFQSGALHPLIEGPLPSPDRLPQYLQPMLLEHAEEGGKAKRKGVGRVAQPFNLIEELKFRVAFRGKGIEEQEPTLGFRYTHHFLEHRFRLGYMVESVLAANQIEAGVREGNVFGVGAGKRDVGDLFFGLEFARLAEHFGCQVDAAGETHSWRDRQNKRSRPAGHVENKFVGLGLGKFHFFGQRLGCITHRELSEGVGGLGELFLDGFFMLPGHKSFQLSAISELPAEG
jgi:hypothetical protein